MTKRKQQAPVRRGWSTVYSDAAGRAWYRTAPDGSRRRCTGDGTILHRVRKAEAKRLKRLRHRSTTGPQTRDAGVEVVDILEAGFSMRR